MEEFQSTNEQLCLAAASQNSTRDQLLSLQGFAGSGPPVSRQSSIITPGLRYRNLGKSGLRVSNVGLGTWVTFGSGLCEETAEGILVAAYEAGVNLFDLSEAHSGVKAELELGRILHRKNWKRSSFIVATKIYWNSKSDERGLSRKHIIESVKESLNRLELNYIDIVIVHRSDPMCPTEEVVRAMNHAINQGWIMYWGTSRWSPVEIMEAYSNCRQFNCATPIIEQTEYHMFCRDKAELYMPELYNKIGVGMMAWSPISMALVSGKIEEFSVPVYSKSTKNKYASYSWTEDETHQSNRDIQCGSWVRNERCQPDDTRRQQEKLREILTIADKLGCTLTQLCIAWTLKNESVQCLLIGATSIPQLYQALHCLQLVPKLNAAIMSEVERVLENKPARPPMVSTLALR